MFYNNTTIIFDNISNCTNNVSHFIDVLIATKSEGIRKSL